MPQTNPQAYPHNNSHTNSHNKPHAEMVCPSCKQPMYETIFEATFEATSEGMHETMHEKTNAGQCYLVCRCCDALTPVLNGFAFFSERDIAGSHLWERTRTLQDKFDDTQSYQDYCDTKQQRSVMEVYAAFQPFNESCRAIYPFIDYLQQQLKPGDLILDTWARTGWSSFLLAALFPEQRVVAIWEGDNSVLGYTGYSYWFSAERRPSNLTVIFLASHQDLPFPDNSAALIHGHDIVHRRPMPHYLQDVIRVGREDGTILLPHIHLSNSEPDPYFKRGGQYRHSRDYYAYLKQCLSNDKREVRLLSEPALFEQSRPLQLTNTAEFEDYNGMIVIANSELLNGELTENFLLQVDKNTHAVTNPLLLVCPLTGLVLFNEQGLGNQLDYLLQRHPVYKHRLERVLSFNVSTLQRQILQLCDQHKSVAAIAYELQMSEEQVQSHLLELSQHELIAVLPVTQAALDLQRFHSNRHCMVGLSFESAWQNLIERQIEVTIVTIQGEPLSVQELQQIVNAWRRYLQLRGDVAELYLDCDDPLLVPLVIACWLEGTRVRNGKSINEKHITVTDQSNRVAGLQINLSEHGENHYWDLLEPFLTDDLLPDSNREKQPAAVDQCHWWQWLRDHNVSC
jgi:DNA-binding CsgD family transcriptional regulator